MRSTLKPGSVVVGVDGSPHSDAAVAWAVAYACKRHAPLLLVNGAGVVGSEPFVSHSDARSNLRIAARRVTDHALTLVQHQAPELDVSVSAPLDDPRQALLDLSEQAAMIVLGTRGHGMVRSLLLGSVSVAVAEHAQCPVTVVRGIDEAQANAGHIVVGVGLDGSSTAALELAFDLAAENGVPLDVVHAWGANDTFVDVASYQQRTEILERHEQLVAEQVAGYAEKYPDVVITTTMPDAGAVGALVARSEDASHIVLGTHGRHGVRSLLGSVSRGVLQHAHCPVTVVRPVD